MTSERDLAAEAIKWLGTAAEQREDHIQREFARNRHITHSIADERRWATIPGLRLDYARAILAALSPPAAAADVEAVARSPFDQQVEARAKKIADSRGDPNWWRYMDEAVIAIRPPAAPEGLEAAILDDIASIMNEFVDNWPHPKRIDTALKLIAKTLRAALDPPKHSFWGAGEPDCPREIKAGNGELHTLRCKNCGEDNPRDNRCLNPIRNNTGDSMNYRTTRDIVIPAGTEIGTPPVKSTRWGKDHEAIVGLGRGHTAYLSLDVADCLESGFIEQVPE